MDVNDFSCDVIFLYDDDKVLYFYMTVILYVFLIFHINWYNFDKG